MKSLKLISVGLLIALTSNAQSLNNNVIASGGTLLKSGNVQLEYTVGETLTSTLSSASNQITQGFHQPSILIARINGGEGESESESESEMQNAQSNNRITNNTITYHFDVYPNPATDFVNIHINQIPESKCELLLTDETGKVINRKSLVDSETRIDFTQLAAAKYFITIKTDDGKVKESFKVIKMN